MAFKDGREVEPLIAALGDRDAEVRRLAVEALSAFGDDRKVDRLTTPAEHDPDPTVKLRARETIARLQNIAAPR